MNHQACVTFLEDFRKAMIPVPVKLVRVSSKRAHFKLSGKQYIVSLVKYCDGVTRIATAEGYRRFSELSVADDEVSVMGAWLANQILGHNAPCPVEMPIGIPSPFSDFQLLGHYEWSKKGGDAYKKWEIKRDALKEKRSNRK